MALFGGMIAMSGICMSMELERGSEGVINMGLWRRTKFVFKEVWTGLQIRELYRAVIFYTIMGCVIPNYLDYMYYYQTDVAGFS